MHYLFCGLIFLAADTPTTWHARLALVESNYDIAQAQEFVEELRAERDADTVLAEAVLVLAELHRIDFEALDDSDRTKRRTLGKRIDALADEALRVVDALAESSITQRLTADLLGVKIRSNYQAKKYRKRMERAAARAIELDPSNAAAYVSASKPYLFAGEHRRGDIDRAVQLLETALEHNPKLEKAHLLLALAHERKGELEQAKRRYKSALRNNPNCRPAAEALIRLSATIAGGSP